MVLTLALTQKSVQNFAIRISFVKNLPKCLRKLNVFVNKFSIDVSSLLMSPLGAIVICPKYFGNHMISSQIHLFAPLLDHEALYSVTFVGCDKRYEFFAPHPD